MDELTSYRGWVKQVLAEHAALANRSRSAKAASYCAFDDVHGVYLIARAGWDGYKRVLGTPVFIRLADGKIHVEEDLTEDGVAPALLRLGVPSEHIVPAFQGPDVRRLAERVAV